MYSIPAPTTATHTHTHTSHTSQRGSLSNVVFCLTLEEDKRAPTNVQNGLVFSFLFSKKDFILRKVLGEIY